MGGVLEQEAERGAASESTGCQPPPARPFLHVSIDSPLVKLKLSSDSPERSLAEIRRIIEALGAEPEESVDLLDDAALYDLKARLSEEFFAYPPLLTRLKNALVLDEDVRILKKALPLEREYDLDTGKQTRQMSSLGVKTVINPLFDQLGKGAVRDCLVHIRGELSREQQTVVMDAIRQRLGVEVQPRFFSTRKNLEGKALVEAVCFGEGLGSPIEEE